MWVFQIKAQCFIPTSIYRCHARLSRMGSIGSVDEYRSRVISERCGGRSRGPQTTGIGGETKWMGVPEKQKQCEGKEMLNWRVLVEGEGGVLNRIDSQWCR